MSEPRQVPLLDLRRLGPDVDEELRAAFDRVLTSGHFILGPEVEAFERECADYLGARHAVGVSSGSDALLLALMALGIGPGDEVLCPTFTFFATAGAIARLGARPIFCDIDAATFNCSAATVGDRLTSATRAIVPVHLFGRAVEMAPLVALAAARGVPIVEDAAQAFGAETGGRRAGTLGTFGCFSFFPSKNLGALGDAGLVTTDDDRLADQARLLRSHGSRPKYHHRVVGGNFRIDALQAALLRVKLRRLDSWTAARQENARRYSESFAHRFPAADSPLLIPGDSESRHIFNQYVIRVRGKGARDRLRAFLRDRGIGTEIYYPIPMHLQECFAGLGYRAGDFPIAEAVAAEVLALPIFPGLEAAEIDYVVDGVAGFFAA